MTHRQHRLGHCSWWPLHRYSRKPCFQARTLREPTRTNHCLLMRQGSNFEHFVAYIRICCRTNKSHHQSLHFHRSCLLNRRYNLLHTLLLTQMLSSHILLQERRIARYRIVRLGQSSLHQDWCIQQGCQRCKTHYQSRHFHRSCLHQGLYNLLHTLSPSQTP